MFTNTPGERCLQIHQGKDVYKYTRGKMFTNTPGERRLQIYQGSEIHLRGRAFTHGVMGHQINPSWWTH